MLNIDKDELTIYEVESLHKDLLDVFKNGDVIVDMGVVNKIDMSVIQLFISTKKSCLESSKNFQLTNVNEEVSKIFQSAGCLSLIRFDNE